MSSEARKRAKPRRRLRLFGLAALERMADGPLLSVGEVCHVLGLSAGLVRDLIAAGDMPGVRIGKNYRVRWHSLRAYCFRIGALPLPEGERPQGGEGDATAADRS